MPGVSYALANFITGGPILDLPVKEGATWGAQLNRPDAVACQIDLNDIDNRKLDLRSASEPNKTILLARNDADVVLAWGVIGDGDRGWDEDTRTVSLQASGVEASYFSKTPIAPPLALTAPLTTLDPEGYPIVNPALDTVLTGWSHGTIGKKLVEQQLAFPGAPTIFDLPPDEVGTRSQTWLFSSMKRINAALSDITRQEGGSDFAFDAYRASDGLSLRVAMRHGTEAEPRIGSFAGIWSLGEDSPITGLSLRDAVGAGASIGWMTAGRQSGAPLISRVLNPDMLAAGYPPFAVVDTTHSDVSVQATLDSYNLENINDAARVVRDLSFTVRGDATPGLGQFRPGDFITIDVGDSHPWHTTAIPIRVTSISGDETGKTITVGCVVLDA